ncbi:hypothetical protein FACUT_54 [Fusarium acutatum]|uniref:Uncharacterized protein n=1 Tax=Fusarium acutatum TaxID=78861 RepID=A0A8H4KA81_9HYPO|nr:hypothetical protein FACUT_54 [Fusarium acutatum]
MAFSTENVICANFGRKPPPPPPTPSPWPRDPTNGKQFPIHSLCIGYYTTMHSVEEEPRWPDTEYTKGEE